MSLLTGLLESVRSTTLLYWKDERIPANYVLALLLGNSILIILARSVTFDWPEGGASGLLTTVLVELLALFILIIALFASMLRKGSRMPDDVHALAKLLATSWLLALALFSFNIFPPLNVLDRYRLETTWPLAMGYSLITCIVLVLYTLNRTPAERPRLATLVMPAFWVLLSTTVFVQVMVLDDATDDWLRENAENLAQMLPKISEPAR